MPHQGYMYMYMYTYVYIGNTCLHIVDTVFSFYTVVATMKYPREDRWWVPGRSQHPCSTVPCHPGTGRLLWGWGGGWGGHWPGECSLCNPSKCAKSACHHPSWCHNEQRGDSGWERGRRSNGGLENNRQPGGCWGAEKGEIWHKLKCFTF